MSDTSSSLSPADLGLPLMLTIAEAGKVLGLKSTAAYRLANDGSMPTVNVTPSKRMVPAYALIRAFNLDGKGA